MLVDIYQSGVNSKQFVAIPTGHSLEDARIPDVPDLVELQLCLQGTDITSSGEFVDVDAQAILEQVTNNGFALFQAVQR